jgi:hypothetical protein
MRFFFLVVLFSCLNVMLYAGTIKGVVRNAEGAPLASANLILLRSTDSSIMKTEVSDAQGHYQMEWNKEGTYLIKVIAAGYEPAYSSAFACGAAVDLNIQDISLRHSQKDLGEVTVHGQKPLIEVKADKIVMNVESSITATGSTALEVLQRAPGVTVDQNDNISLKGKQGVNIMLDGKLVPISGQELANMLKGMPSGSIEKIEIISNPGARYDAAGRAGIINIRTKRDKRMGANATLTGGYSQGIYPKANVGAGLNYRNKKLVLYTNYNYAYRHGINDLQLYRRFYDSSQVSAVYRQTNTMSIPFNNHFATLGMDYSLSSKTTIGAVLTGGYFRFDINSLSTADIMNADEVPVSSYRTTRDAKNFSNNIGVNLNLRHRIDTAGSELSADVDYARYNNNSDQILHTMYKLPDGTQQAPDYLLYGLMNGYTDIRSFKADYTRPLPDDLRLEAGVKASLVHADNDPTFYDQSTGVSVYDSGKSNHFIYDENINAIYVNAAKEWTKWSMQAGVRAEQTIAKGHQLVNDERFDRNYAQLFPSLALTRHINKQNDLGITLSRRIDRPAYQQLNPFRRYLDQTSVNQGNPYLRPALTWSVELTHTWKGKFITQLNYSRTSDAIINVIQPEAGQTTVVTDKNLATNVNYTFSGAYPIQPVKWWSSTNSIAVYYNYFEGDLANTPLNAGQTAVQISTQNTITLSKAWTSELTFYYQSPERYGYMRLRPDYVLSAGVQKSFHEGLATVKFSVTDIFLRQNPRGTSEFAQYYEDFVVVRDSRVATLQATYRFGKRSVTPVRRRQRGAEEELRRAASSAS